MSKLFHWSCSTALKNYSCGDIIVMAESVEAARAAAREYALDWLKEDHREWWFDFERNLDPDYAEDHANWMAELDRDLAKEPDLVDHPIFIQGSE